MANLFIFPIESGPVATFGYLVADTAAGVGAVIDVPLGSAEFFLETAKDERLTIQAIWLTHSHWDHTADAPALKRATGAPVFVHQTDEYRMKEPNKYIGFPIGVEFEAMNADGYFTHGGQISCGAWSFEVRHTPGHTEGGVCFIDHARKIAFVGDTLFAGSVGRTDLVGGDTQTLLRSIQEQLLTLPDDFTVLPGHGTYTSIGAERRSNPFLQDLRS
jgi:glyoxylase-like metal-dependent hydrolase (beta-lactamase superfamily II)